MELGVTKQVVCLSDSKAWDEARAQRSQIWRSYGVKASVHRILMASASTAAPVCPFGWGLGCRHSGVLESQVGPFRDHVVVFDGTLGSHRETKQQK